MIVHHNEITGAIVDRAIYVHRKLGPGLLESVYRKVLAFELRKLGYGVSEEQPIPLVWEDVRLELGFRADMIVNHMVVVELKSVENVPPVYMKQLLTHLRLTDKRVGLLINFNVELLKNGIFRVVNNLRE